MLGIMKLEELSRIMSEALDKAFDKPAEMTRSANQRLAGLEQEARQSRLATEADVPTATKTRKRTESASAAEREINGNNCSAQVTTDSTNLLSFGDAGPPALPCTRVDALVNNGAAAPKLCLSPAKMRTHRWHSLYSDENHILLVAFFIVLDQRDIF